MKILLSKFKIKILIQKLKMKERMSTQNFSKIQIKERSEITPSYESSRFDILEYRKVSVSKEVIYSNELVTNGLIWKLKIYPNGNGVAKNEYISIFLELFSVHQVVI